MLPMLLPAVARFAKSGVARTIAAGVGGLGIGGAAGFAAGRLTRGKGRRRRRGLTKGELGDVQFLAGNISKKAAENYLLRRRT